MDHYMVGTVAFTGHTTLLEVRAYKDRMGHIQSHMLTLAVCGLQIHSNDQTYSIRVWKIFSVDIGA